MAVKAAKKKTAKKARDARAFPRVDGVHDIQIDSAGNATVTTTPTGTRGYTHVRFTSNRPDTAVKYTRLSPFAQMGIGEPLKTGTSEGPLKCVRGGGRIHHFDCGSLDSNGQFVPWGNPGGDTPVDPNVPPT